jgi:sigma-B regulation protein RsbU (phosphoserine phosphatase)
MNPADAAETPLCMVPPRLVSDYGEEVYRLACMELRGGNRAALYRAELPGLNAWVSCRPLYPATRGGDLYYLSVCSRGSVSRVTIADVAGHGEHVGPAAERLRDALREHANHWDQSDLIRRLNDSFFHASSGGEFATAILLSHYAGTGELLFTNAGHLPPLWHHAALGQWSFLQDTTPYSREIADLPLGLIPGTTYRQTAIRLEPNDLLLVYTDGVNESHDEQGEQLGLDRLLEMAGGLPTGSASCASEEHLAPVARFRGAAPPVDDETVVALHSNPAPPNYPGSYGTA